MRYPELAGPVALVRGAASGIGAATGTSTLGVAADVADGIVFVLSGASFYITGHVPDSNGWPRNVLLSATHPSTHQRKDTWS